MMGGNRTPLRPATPTRRPSSAGRARPGTADSTSSLGLQASTYKIPPDFTHQFRKNWRRVMDACRALDKANTGVIRFVEFREVLSRYRLNSVSEDDLHRILSQVTGGSHQNELAEYLAFVQSFGPAEARTASRTSLDMNDDRNHFKPGGVRKNFSDLGTVSWNNQWKQESAVEEGSSRSPLMSKLMEGFYYGKNVNIPSFKRVHVQAFDDSRQMPLVQSLVQGAYYNDEDMTTAQIMAASRARKVGQMDYVTRNKKVTKRFSDMMKARASYGEASTSGSSRRPMSAIYPPRGALAHLDQNDPAVAKVQDFLRSLSPSRRPALASRDRPWLAGKVRPQSAGPRSFHVRGASAEGQQVLRDNFGCTFASTAARQQRDLPSRASDYQDQ